MFCFKFFRSDRGNVFTEKKISKFYFTNTSEEREREIIRANFPVEPIFCV